MNFVGTFWALVPPIIAITLALITKEAYSSLFIGVVIGAAFGKITTSLVNDIIMPLIGLITGGIDLTQWNIVLNRAAVAAGDAAPVMLGIGNLLAVILDFIIVAFAMFLLVKAMNKLAALKKKDEEPAPEEPAGPTTEELLAEIRDLLKEQK